MLPDIGVILHTASIWALPVLLAITLHEAAHGFAANALGDSTAKSLGRVTLNPIKHVDPIGTIALPVLLLLVKAPVLLGWAKPVPVNFSRLKRFRRDTALVALAGPGANLVLTIASFVLLHIAVAIGPGVGNWLQEMCIASIKINLVLMVFNLLPILPLDGGRVLSAMLPPKASMTYSRTEPYGMIVIIILAFTGILFKIIMPVMLVMIAILEPLAPSYLLR